MERTVFIGDVHGCARELEDLLEACAVAAGDAVVLVGDLVAKGPDSAGVIALARRVSAHAVRGNHDHAVLRFREALSAGTAPAHGPEHLRLARELSAEHLDFLAGLPLFLRVPEHDVIVVHAGLVPGVPLEAQEPDLLLNMRTLRPDGSGSRRAEDGVLWGARWPGPELAVFGHHASAGLQLHAHAIGLDTGCVYGGKLTAYLLPEDRFVAVPARAAYAPIENKASRGRT